MTQPLPPPPPTFVDFETSIVQTLAWQNTVLLGINERLGLLMTQSDQLRTDVAQIRTDVTQIVTAAMTEIQQYATALQNAAQNATDLATWQATATELHTGLTSTHDDLSSLVSKLGADDPAPSPQPAP